MENKRQKGSFYERVAEQYLREQGYRILTRNYRTKAGEIDLIAQQGEYLCFVEVKYREGKRYGLPQEAVTGEKQRTIRRTALLFLVQNHLPEDTPCRFDVVAILDKEVTLIQDAF